MQSVKKFLIATIEFMRPIVGILVIIIGIIAAVYVGLYLFFIRGIIEIINEIKTPGIVNNLNIVCAILKIVFAGFVGYVITILSIFIGKCIVGE